MPKSVRVNLPNSRPKKIDIPVGFTVVQLNQSGSEPQSGDLFLNLLELEKGSVCFETIEEDDLFEMSEFSLLIRRCR